MDNKLDQMQISIVILDEKYDVSNFTSLSPAGFVAARKKLLEDIQTEVDLLTGVFNGFDITS